MKQALLSYTTPLTLFLVLGCTSSDKAVQPPEPCSKVWYQQLESTLSTGDGMGHGPDIGSEEWQSVIEYKLGVRGQHNVPARSTEAWCIFIDQLM
jgi:hypothetical protein